MMFGAVVLALTGCFGPAGELQVVSISPEADSTDVLIDAVVTVEVSAVLDGTTVTPDTVQLRSESIAGAAVEAEVTVTGSSLTIEPDEALDFGTPYAVVLAGTIADQDGNSFSGEVSWAFTTRPLSISARVGGSGQAGVEISLDGAVLGTTGSEGTLAARVASGSPALFGGSKKLFQDAFINAARDGSSYEVELNMLPYIFVPDFNPDNGGPKVYRITSVDADPVTFDSITSVEHGAGPTTYTLTGPRWIEVDYNNGAIYITDASAENAPVTLVRLADFPPAADGSEALVVDTSGPNELYGTQQFVVQQDGTLVVPHYESFTLGDSFIVEVPPNLDFASAQIGTLFNSGYFYGLDQLPSGEILIVGGTVSLGTTSLAKLDDVSDTTLTDFVTDGTVDRGSSANQFYIPTRIAVDPDGDHVYISDTGDRGNAINYNNSRIVRYNTDGSSGTEFTPYGTRGTGTDQFFNPVILGLLPDNKLYIMDVNNARLVRIDPGVFDGGSSEWAESDALANFEFEYWYNYS